MGAVEALRVTRKRAARPRRAADRPRAAYAAAERELTDAQIAERFGDVIEAALRAFVSDGGYVEDMAAQSAYIADRRHKAAERRGDADDTGVRRDACDRGHDLTVPENLYVYPNGRKRQCRVCVRDAARERYHRAGGGSAASEGRCP